jgi:hypothetical protein
VGSETFDRVQALLKSRNPRVNPPRAVTGRSCSPAWPSAPRAGAA